MFLTVVVCAMAAIMVAFVSQDSSQQLVQLFLAGFAVVGVFSLFAGALGLLHFGDYKQINDLTESFAENMGEGLLITGPDGSIEYANSAYRQFMDIGPNEELQTVEQALVGSVEISEHIFRLVRAAKNGEFWVEEFRLSSGAGKVEEKPVDLSRWFRVTVMPLSGNESKDTKTKRMAWRIAEVTEERMCQERAFQELQKAIKYLDYAPAGFFSSDANGKIDYMNATLAQWLGIDLGDSVSGKLHLPDIVSGDGAALLVRAEPDNCGESFQELDLDLIRSDNTSLPVRLLHKVSRLASGVIETQTMVLDRSPVLGQNDDVRAAEVRFARFFQSAPIAIATVDPDGKIGNTNAAFARMFNRSGQSATKAGISIFDLISPQDGEDLKRAIEAAKSGQVGITPVDITFGSEGDFNGRFFISPIEQSENDREAAIIYAIDTTEQKTLEIQIAQSQKMQAVGQLAGGIAHDFNNVLTAIIGFSDLLLVNHRPTDPAFKDIMNIKQNANRAAGLVRQLLAFSRQQTLRPEILSLTDVISDLQVLLSRLLGEKIDLKVIHGRDLWFVKADLNQFEQVIINLAVNARDAMQGGGQLTIETRNISEQESLRYGNGMITRGEYVLCEVADTGCGIPQNIIEKIFDPFFSTKEVGKGTGLGLSTVYGIVKQTGGYIFPESEIGEGTVFRIFLPRQAEEKSRELAEAGRADKREKPRDLTGSGSVLLVEDEEAVRSFAARALASRGYKVLEAGSGLEALDVMAAHNGDVDLVVSDVVMPEMDGPTLLKELRVSNPELKIIFISGYAEDAFKKNLGEEEKFVFLPKPFSLKQLAGAVKEVLQS